VARYKLPISVLVIVHTSVLEVLLLERARHPGFWQSVTGSLDLIEEALEHAAVRELREETGLEVPPSRLRNWHLEHRYEIFAQWRDRYAPGVRENTEHVFSLELPFSRPVRLEPSEHSAQIWLPWREAADKCFSWSNRDAIRMLGEGRVPAD
jgi:dATP pyrophosphohydrolase